MIRAAAMTGSYGRSTSGRTPARQTRGAMARSRRRARRGIEVLVGVRKDELEQLHCHCDEARASVEAPSRPIALLDDDPERRGPLRNRVALRVGEKPPSDSAPLVAGRDEQLLDHDRAVRRGAKSDVAGRPALFAGDEDDVATQDSEHATVAPTG